MAANLLRFEQVKEMAGQTVYEEWLYGTGTIPTTVLSVVSDNVLFMEHNTDNSRYCARKQDKEYRFWDSEPTLDQRELTDWKRTV